MARYSLHCSYGNCSRGSRIRSSRCGVGLQARRKGRPARSVCHWGPWLRIWRGRYLLCGLRVWFDALAGYLEGADLGVNVKFSMYTVRDAEGSETLERAAHASIEGVAVTFKKLWLGPNAGDGKQYEWTLFPDLAGLGAAIQAREDAVKAKAEHEARLAPVRAARTCNWCKTVVTINWNGETVTDDFPTERANAEALAQHKKEDCYKVPWLRRIGHQGLGTG
jgi:hypothetical protein